MSLFSGFQFNAGDECRLAQLAEMGGAGAKAPVNGMIRWPHLVRSSLYFISQLQEEEMVISCSHPSMNSFEWDGPFNPCPSIYF